jgi:DNA ligase-1
LAGTLLGRHPASPLLVPTPFARFAATCDALRQLDGRNAKREGAAELLAAVDRDERAPTARFLAGQTLSPLDERDLNVGSSVLADAAGEGQTGLFGGEATIADVARVVDGLADVSGPGSGQRRSALLGGLLGRLDEDEQAWLRALFLGELRTGVQEGLVLDAIAEAADEDAEIVRRAHQLRGDVGEVAARALADDEPPLADVDLELGRPLGPMLAEKAEDLETALAEAGPRAFVEPKLDGARIQIHRRGEDVRVFSRRLTEVTDSLPEAREVGDQLDAEQALAVGEVYAVDEDGRPRPFPDLMRRFRREHERRASRAEVPLEVRLFDLLHADGGTLIDEPLSDRRSRLEELAPGELVTPVVRTSIPAEAERFYDQAQGEGHEGVMVKAAESTYEPGRRGRSWLKVKPVETLDLIVLGAEWGHGRRSAWLSNYHLGVRVPADQRHLLQEPTQPGQDPVTRRDGHAMVTKTFKGLTDEQFGWMTDRLQQLAVEEPGWGVVVEPSLVVEVTYEGVQDSSKYRSGHALRFARITAIRDDKPVRGAATVADVAATGGPR